MCGKSIRKTAMTNERERKSVKPPLECMVCGKLFPRGKETLLFELIFIFDHLGALDLARHQSALTLLHRVGEKKTSALPYGCKFCGYHFSTIEHLELHSNQSSCGKRRSGFYIPDDECLICSAPSLVDGIHHETLFPKHISSPSKRLNMQHICSKCGLYFISEEIVAEHSKHSFCTRFEAQKDRVREGESSNVEEKINEQPLSSKRPRLSKDDSYELRASPLSSTDQQTTLRRTKRIKYLIPAGHQIKTLPPFLYLLIQQQNERRFILCAPCLLINQR
jgi:predicted Zn-ribbon and HTH transcriptional regulator